MVSFGVVLPFSAVSYVVMWFALSVMAGSKRASDDGQDVETEENGHAIKRPRQECNESAELRVLLPSRVSTVLGFCQQNLFLQDMRFILV